MVVGALLAGHVRGDAIAVSFDGKKWVSGAGPEAGGWGSVGQSVSVTQGGDFFIRYYSTTDSSAALYCAAHGTPWGSWTKAGPALTDSNGRGPDRPVILHVTDVGTPKSRARWINGPWPRRSWPALTSPGPYDLAIGPGAQWTLPPLRIVRPPGNQAIPIGVPVSTPQAQIVSVPDTAGTLTLVIVGLCGLVAFYVTWRKEISARNATSSRRDAKR